ncbi:MAG: hypothetical protein K0Q43_518 [Ramlibacter sp.]|nr:hypothetical protein [Ramlibacter sp.]
MGEADRVAELVDDDFLKKPRLALELRAAGIECDIALTQFPGPRPSQRDAAHLPRQAAPADYIGPIHGTGREVSLALVVHVHITGSLPLARRLQHHGSRLRGIEPGRLLARVVVPPIDTLGPGAG